MIVVLDDLHWAGEDVVAVLRELRSCVAVSAARLVMAYRTGEEGSTPDLMPFVADLVDRGADQNSRILEVNGRPLIVRRPRATTAPLCAATLALIRAR